MSVRWGELDSQMTKSCLKIWLYIVYFKLNTKPPDWTTRSQVASQGVTVSSPLSQLLTGGKKKKNQQRRTLHHLGRSVSSQITFFPSAPPRRGVHLRRRCRALLPLPPSSSHKILLHYILGECHKFCLFFFFFQRMRKKRKKKNVSWRALKNATGEIKIDVPACLSEEKI